MQELPPDRLALLCQALPGLPPILEMEIGIVVGTHGGPGIIGLSWIAQQENS